MPKNFLGLGFSFGAEDKGLTEFQDKVEQGFTNIEGAAQTAQKKAGEAGKGMASSFDSRILDSFTDSVSDFYDTLEAGGLAGGESVEWVQERLDDLSDTLEGTGDEAQNFGEKSEEAFEKAGKSSETATKGVDLFSKALSHVVKNPLAKLPRLAGSGMMKMQGLGAAMGTFNKMLGQMKMQTFLQSLEALKDKASGMGDALTGGINLTTGLEAEMAQLGKAARAQGAQMGYAGKALAKFSKEAGGIAYSLGVGEEAAAQAVRAFDEAGDELKAMGFESAKAVAKLEAGGVAIDGIRNASMRMTRQLDLSEDQVGNISRALLAMGEVSGDVPGALNLMDESLTALGARRRALGDTPEQVEDFMLQIAGASAAMFQFNQDSAKSRDLVVGLATSMTEADISFSDMFGGVGTDVPDALSSLAVVTGDVNEAMDLMRGGPAEFMKAMSMLDWATIDEGSDAYNFMRAQLSQAMDPAQAEEFLLSFKKGNTEAGKAALALIDDVTKAERTLNDFANDAHRTGRTLQESFDRAKDSFVMGFRKHGRAAARLFVKDSSQQFKQFNKTLSELVAKGGPMSAVVTKMSEMHQIGGLALVPRTLRPMATVMGTVVNEAAPMVTMMGSLGFQFKHLMSPLGLATAGVVALGLAFKTSRDDAQMQVDALMRSGKAIRKEGKAVKALEKKLSGLTEGTQEYARIKTEMDKKKLALNAAKGIKAETEQIDKLRKSMGKAAKKGKDTSAMQAEIAERESKIADWRGDIQSAADERTKQGIKDTAKAIIEGVKQVAKMLPGLLKDVAAEVWQGLQFVAGVVDDAVGDLWEKAWDIEGPEGGGWEAWWDNIFARMFGAGKKSGASILPKLWDEIVAIFDPNKEAKTPVGRIIERLGEVAYLVVGGLVKSVAKAARAVQWKDMFAKLGGGVGKLYKTIGGLLSRIPWNKIFGEVFRAATVAVEFVTGPEIGKMMRHITTAVGSYTAELGKAFVVLFEEALYFLEEVDTVTVLEGFQANLVEAVSGLVDGLLPLFRDFTDRLPDLLESAGTTVVDFFAGLPALAAAQLSLLKDKVREFLPKIVPMLIDGAIAYFEFVFWDLPITILKNFPGLVVGAFELAWEGVGFGVDALFGLFDGIIVWAEENFPSVGEPLRAAFDAVASIWDGIKASMEGFFEWLGAGAQKIYETVSAIVENLDVIWAGLMTDLSTAWSGTWEGIGILWDAFWVSMGEKWDAFWLRIDEVGTAISEGADSLVESGRAFVNNILLGAQEAWADFMEWLHGGLKEIKDMLPFSEPQDSTSPLSNLGDSGKAIVNNIWQGLKDAWGGLTSWVSSGLESVMGGISGAIEGGASMVSDTMDAVTGDVAGNSYSPLKRIMEDKERKELVADVKVRRGKVAAMDQPLQDQLHAEIASLVEKGEWTGFDQTDELIAKYQKMQEEGPAAFAAVDEAAIATFGNSVHTQVEEDLGMATLQIAVWGGMTAMQFAKITQTFAGSFDTMAENVETRFVSMWGSILGVTANAVEAIMDDVDAVASELGSVASALERVKSAKEVVKATDMEAAAPEPALLKQGQSVQEALLQQTAAPNWYWKDYVARFERLISAVAELKTGGGASKGRGGEKRRASSSRNAMDTLLGIQ